MTTKVALLHSLVVAIAKTALACSFPIQAGSKEKKKRGGSKEKQEARKRKKKKKKKGDVLDNLPNTSPFF